MTDNENGIDGVVASIEGLDDLFSSEVENEIIDNNEAQGDENGKDPLENDSLGIDSEPDTKGEDKEDESDNDKKSALLSSDVKYDYKDVIKGVFGDIGSVLDEDDNEVSFDELDLSDRNRAIELIKNIIEVQYAERSKGLVDLSSTSELAKQIFEAEQNGGKAQDVINAYQMLKEPVANLNMKDAINQEFAVRLLLKHKGYDDSDSDMLIKGYKAEGKLEQAGIAAVSQMDKLYEAERERINTDKAKREEVLNERLRKHGENIFNSLSNYSIDKKKAKEIVDFATKRDKDGSLAVTKAFTAMINDPENAHKLALFLMNPDSYDSIISNYKVKEKTKSIYRLAQSSSKSRNGSAAGSDNKKEKIETIDLDDLIE